MDRPPFDLSFLQRFSIPVKRYETGEKIFIEDDPGTHMFIVLEGKVNIVSYGSVLENVAVNGVFGEMALIDDEPRSATAIAVEPTELLLIDKERFFELVRADPTFSLHVMRLLAYRIRRMNQYL